MAADAMKVLVAATLRSRPAHLACALGEAAGDDFLVPSRQILALGRRPPTLVGPLLEEEGRARHLAYWQRPASP